MNNPNPGSGNEVPPPPPQLITKGLFGLQNFNPPALASTVRESLASHQQPTSGSKLFSQQPEQPITTGLFGSAPPI